MKKKVKDAKGEFVAFRLPPELKKKLEALAAQQHHSLSSYVRHILLTHIEKK